MISAETKNRISSRLDLLYQDRAAEALAGVEACIAKFEPQLKPLRDAWTSKASHWSERDVVLITYADQVQQTGKTPLASLADFLDEANWTELINTVHILPFYPFSSDDGFSVIDYAAVNPDFGDWPDVEKLGEKQQLMFDFVCNHMSAKSAWFQSYLSGEQPFDEFFIEADPHQDLSEVVRPRSLPLLTEVETSRGKKHVWTTFSADQVDLNFASPEVLKAMLGVLLDYVARGARIVRLDAIAYLWKEIGTNCIHLPQTHEVVKLMRDVAAEVAPQVLILTETNVPHAENISYFGNGDEAHMVYQFSLPPLLLDAMLSGDAAAITAWLSSLGDSPSGTTYFNFTASHDGIGVRPLEGLVPDEQLFKLADHARSRGGYVGTRRRADGSDSPYELNISYFDALGDPDKYSAELHVRRFLSTQAVMLAMRGIPGIYFHSLVGTPNDRAAAQASGIPRRINRRKYQREELESILADSESTQPQVCDGYRKLLAARIAESAFHPDASQTVLESGDRGLLAFERKSASGDCVICLVNFTGDDKAWSLPDDRWQDLLGNAMLEGQSVSLPAYAAAWLKLVG